jgi:hypothetical protein
MKVANDVTALMHAFTRKMTKRILMLVCQSFGSGEFVNMLEVLNLMHIFLSDLFNFKLLHHKDWEIKGYKKLLSGSSLHLKGHCLYRLQVL